VQFHAEEESATRAASCLLQVAQEDLAVQEVGARSSPHGAGRSTSVDSRQAPQRIYDGWGADCKERLSDHFPRQDQWLTQNSQGFKRSFFYSFT